MKINKIDWTRNSGEFLGLYKFEDGGELEKGESIFCKVITRTFKISRLKNGLLKMEITVHNEKAHDIKLPTRYYVKEYDLKMVMDVAEELKNNVVRNFVLDFNFQKSKWFQD